MCGVLQVLNKSNKQKNYTECLAKVEAPENVFPWGRLGVGASKTNPLILIWQNRGPESTENGRYHDPLCRPQGLTKSQVFWLGAVLDPWLSFVKSLSSFTTSAVQYLLNTNNSGVKLREKELAGVKEPAAQGAALDCNIMSDFPSQFQRCPFQFSTS